jgi:hypothetical protein
LQYLQRYFDHITQDIKQTRRDWETLLSYIAAK